MLKSWSLAFHLGQLKAKLAKLKRELLTPSSSGGGGPGIGFDVARTGEYTDAGENVADLRTQALHQSDLSVSPLSASQA